MSKRQIVNLIALMALLIGLLLFDQSRKTTFQEVLLNELGSNVNIKEVSIAINESLTNQTTRVIVEDQEVIRELMGNNFKLKKSNEHEAIKNILSVKTANREIHNIYFGRNYVNIGGETYYTMEPTGNPIYQYIIKNEFDWEIIPY